MYQDCWDQLKLLEQANNKRLLTGERRGDNSMRSMALRGPGRIGRLLCILVLVRAYEVLLGSFPGIDSLVASWVSNVTTCPDEGY